MKQIQTQHWLTKTPLISWPYTTINKKHSKFFLDSMLTFCFQNDITFDINPSLINRITGGSHDLSSIFGHDLFNVHLKSLKNQNIMFLEQLTSLDGTILLDWKEIRRRSLSHNPSMRIPLWFEQLQQIVLDTTSTSPRQLQNNYITPQATHMKNHVITPINLYTRSKDWIGIWNPSINQTILGRIVGKWTHNNTITVEHWTNYTHTSTFQSPSLIRCPGCIINNPHFNHIERTQSTDSYTCTNLYYAHDAVPIQSSSPRVQDKKTKVIYHLDTPLYDIEQRAEFHSKFYNMIIPFSHDIDIFHPKENFIEKFIERGPIQKELHAIQHSFQEATTLKFYTDGSVIDIGKESMSMSLAFYQTHWQSPSSTFAATLD